MKLKLHKTKSSIVGRLQKQLTATSLNELSIYHRANVWVNKCQTLLTHPEETDQHRYSTGALSLTTCWIMSNIRWHFLHSFIRQFQNIWLSGFLDVFDCVHQPLSRSGSPPFHAGQEACNQLVCACACACGCPQFNMRGSVRAGMTQQRGPANQNSAWKRLKLNIFTDYLWDL